MADAERPLDEARLAYQQPALESLGSLAELTGTDNTPEQASDGSGYAPGLPGS